MQIRVYVPLKYIYNYQIWWAGNANPTGAPGLTSGILWDFMSPNIVYVYFTFRFLLLFWVLKQPIYSKNY